MNDLAIIKNSSILNEDNYKALALIQKDLEHGFKVNQVFRSRYEMTYGVLNDLKFPTADSKHWQAIREQQVHFQELALLSFEYKKTLAQIELLEAQILKLHQTNGDLTTPARIKLKEIEIEKLEFISVQWQKIAQERVREVTSWAQIIQKLLPQLKYSPDSYEEHQPESYLQRFQNELGVLKSVEYKANDPAGLINMVSQYDMAQKRVKNDSKKSI